MQLETPRLLLQTPGIEHLPQVLDYYIRNREHFAPWGPARQPEWDTAEYHLSKIQQYGDAAQQGGNLWLLIIHKEQPDKIIGDVHLSNIVRGIFQSCHLGYKIDASVQGRGYMREALQAVIDHAFTEMKLHRIEANIMPANLRSIMLVQSLNFEEEGLAKKYLKVNGEWQDHLHYTLLNNDPSI